MGCSINDTYLSILRRELVAAMGCTEPMAIAYAGAKAREVLGEAPTRCRIACSGNIIKNVMGVTVPNSGGMKGIEIAALLGIVGGDANQALEVLASITEAHRQAAKALLGTGFCVCEHLESAENLNIIIALEGEHHSVELEIRDTHSNVVRVVKDGAVILDGGTCADGPGPDAENPDDYALLNVRDILAFADAVALEDIDALISRQIEYNTAIADEGLAKEYGAEVGRTLLGAYGADGAGAHTAIKAAAHAAAGSDARMSGCAMPVVINSGSGNQGITVTLPVVIYARELGVSREKLLRAMVISNLISMHQKKYIGRLSAYCGAVSAACGSGAAICYLLGGTYDEISGTIVNTIANIGGMVCDGAKPSCAAKIASAVHAALLGLYLSQGKNIFQPGDGLVKQDVEGTIASVGRMGRRGMKPTDEEIIQIMLEK